MNQQKSFKKMRGAETPKITVAVRKRPLNRKELQRAETDIVRVGSQGQVVISEYKQKVDLTKYLEETTFNFDYAYDQHSRNEDIYEEAVRPLIENAFKGAKITCFAYGQTGSGKTYTMKGDLPRGVPGVYYLGARQIFRLLEQPQHSHLQVVVTFFQIYCSKLYDLLSNRNLLTIREDNKGQINVIGLNEKLICSAEEFLDVVEEGSILRVTSQNNTNDDSSRSHAILQISLKEKNKVFSKISFIDLAGNERGADHMDQNKQTKIDGAQINKSLLQLKECIRALDQGKSHTPFRGSKLTMVLKDSFIGYCNTVMICNVSPNVSSSQNTMNTLRYADRVKELKRGEDAGERLSKQEMMARELMLPRANNKNCVKVNIQREDDNEDIMAKMDLARAMHDNTQNGYQRVEEKMDIQQPYENRKPGRKTENVPNDVKLFGGNERRALVPASNKETIKGRHTLNQQIPLRARDLTSDIDKQPLLSRNNNLNSANNLFEFDKRSKPFTQNPPNLPSSQFSVNKNQFQAMSNLRSGFIQYRQDHEMLFNREMSLMKEQTLIKNDYRQVQMNGGSYEEEIGNVNGYLRHMDRVIAEREELTAAMRGNLQRMRQEARSAEGATAKLRFDQQQGDSYSYKQSNNLFNNGGMGIGAPGGVGCRSQTRLHVHSSMNGMQFNGFNNYNNHYGDEQLLEGLPGDDSMTRLF